MKRDLYKKGKCHRELCKHISVMKQSSPAKMVNCLNKPLTQFALVISPSRRSSDLDSRIKNHYQIFQIAFIENALRH